jgi:hypothetical protein
MSTVYETVVFLDGDDYDEWEALMYPDRDGVSLGWPDGKEAAMEHLKQWEYGEPTEPYGAPPWGSSDYTYEAPGYVMSWNVGLSYASLTRVTNREENQ